MGAAQRVALIQQEECNLVSTFLFPNPEPVLSRVKKKDSEFMSNMS